MGEMSCLDCIHCSVCALRMVACRVLNDADVYSFCKQFKEARQEAKESQATDA